MQLVKKDLLRNYHPNWQVPLNTLGFGYKRREQTEKETGSADL